MRLIAIGSRIYAVGAGATTALQEYNPATNTWASKAAMPTGREFAAVSSLNNKLQVIGGRNASQQATRAFEEYDPATNTWIVKPSTQILSGFMSGADVMNAKIYLAANDYAAVESYEPGLNLWMPTAKLPGRMQRGDMVTVNGNLFVLNETSFLRGTASSAGEASPKISDIPSVNIDSNGVAHVLWRDGCNDFGVDGQSWNSTTNTCALHYRTFNPSTGAWSTTTTPFGASTAAQEYAATMASNNTLHVAFKAYDQTLARDIISYTKNSGSGWEAPSLATYDYIGNLGEFNLVLDPESNPLLLGRNYGFLPSTERLFFTQLVNGAWTRPETIVSGYQASYSRSKLVTDATGTPVVMYKPDNNAYLTKRLSDGTWSTGVIANTTSQVVRDQFDTAVDRVQNKLYFAYTSTVNGHGEVFMNVADLSIDAVAPTIVLTGPTAGTVFTGGNTTELAWSASDDRAGTVVTLKYSTNGGASFTTIAGNLAASGTYLARQ